MVGIFRNDSSLIRLAWSPLIEPSDGWHISSRYRSAESMSLLDAPEGLHAAKWQTSTYTTEERKETIWIQAG